MTQYAFYGIRWPKYCDTVLSLLDKRNSMSPVKSDSFSAYMEGFSYDLNISACYIKQGQNQLASPLIDKVESTFKATKEKSRYAHAWMPQQDWVSNDR